MAAAGWVVGFTGARAAGVPFIALSTSDPWSAVRVVGRTVADLGAVVVSDCVNGLQGVNRAGVDWVAEIQAAKSGDPAAALFGPVAAPGPIGVSVVEAAQVCRTLPAPGV